MAANCPGIIVAVGVDRYQLGLWVLEHHKVDCVVLDRLVLEGLVLERLLMERLVLPIKVFELGNAAVSDKAQVLGSGHPGSHPHMIAWPPNGSMDCLGSGATTTMVAAEAAVTAPAAVATPITSTAAAPPPPPSAPLGP